MLVNFNILYDSPTIISPNGGETFIGGSIDIQWEEPEVLPSAKLIWYEIFIIENYDPNNNDFVQIATIPSGNSTFRYSIPSNIKGNRCRIAIRIADNHGNRSPFSISANNFIITNKRLPLPSVFEPVSGQTYFSYIPFVFDNSGIIERASQRSFYQIYYSSDSQNIDWTMLKGNIITGTDPFQIDVSNFSPASDYEFKIELVDDSNVSEPVFINNITINNVNYFIIDTLPPKGEIKIQNDSEYSNKRNIVVELTAYDKTTDVKDFRIEQSNITTSGSSSSVIGEYRDMTPLATWYISGGDGVKLIQSRFRDYAGNTLNSIDNTFFRTYKNIGNRDVTAFLYYEGDIWYAFSYGENPSSDYPRLYKNQSYITSLDGEATALAYFDSAIYVAIKDDENKGILQRQSGSIIETVRDNDDEYIDSLQTIFNSLYVSDSVISSMVVFDSKLFLGLLNGELLSFSGSSISVEENTYYNKKSIKKLYTDGNLLYIFFENSTKIMVMYKSSTEDYVFSEVETGD